jgi:long-chain acyl-CoA synthetase
VGLYSSQLFNFSINFKVIEENFIKFKSPKRDDLAIIMYTSGSTGNPKGVMMSHGNILASVKSFPIKLGPTTHKKDIYVAYLPLAHVLELVAELGCYINGIRIGYSSPATLVDNSTAIKRGKKGDLRVLKPTIMAAVPLVLERFCKAVNEKISKANWFTQALFEKGYQYKLNAVRNGKKAFLLDRILFRKISRAVLGTF